MPEGLLTKKRARPRVGPDSIEEQMTRGMPRSDDAEKAILSCFFARPDEIIPHFMEVGKEEWFYHAGNRLLAHEMLWMSGEGKKIDMVLVSQHLIDRGLLEQIGGAFFIAEICGFLPSSGLYPYYCGILQDKWMLRETIRNAEEIKQKTYEGEEGIKMQAESIMGNVSAITSLFQEREKTKTMAEHVAETLDEWQNIADGKAVSARPLRWLTWNNKLGGLRKAYYLLKAERGLGKSSLMHDINLQVSVTAREPEPSVIVSYEMSEKNILKRCIANIAMVESRYVFDPDQSKPSKEIRDQILRAGAKIAASPLHIIYEPGLTIKGIEYRIRKIRPTFFGVDYLQRIPMPSGSKPADRPAVYGDFSRGIFDLRNELDCTAMVLSHTNKDGEASWSAALENDADIALRIDGDEIILDKCRNGQKEGIRLAMELEGRYYRFEQPVPQPQKKQP